MTESDRQPFTWCRQEDRYLPAYRCMLCKTPCPSRQQYAENQFIDDLIAEGKIKEYFVMAAKGTSPPKAAASGKSSQETYFIHEDGKLKPFSPEDYCSSLVYQAVEAFTVERRFVRPEEKQDVLYEGKRPNKKTVPVLVMRNGAQAVLSTWQDLEANPEHLAEVKEVISVKPVKQVFLLKRQ